jgi:hypothetical protein
MNGVLGTPYKFTYTARGFSSGLSLTAKVMRPNGSLHGTYSLTEFVDPSFSGVYFFDLLTTQLNPEGEYTIVVTENDYKAAGKVSMRIPAEGDPMPVCEPIKAIIKTSKLSGIIKSENKLIGHLKPSKVSGTIKASGLVGKIKTNLIKGEIKTQKIIGVIKC